MTEKKRFFESMYWIIDREKGRKLQMYEIIDLLNEQDEEIKELKGKASSWKRTASEEMLEKQDLLKQIVELKEENKKLKKSLLLKRKLENLDLNEK